MLQIKTFVFNPFQENTYVLYDETKEAIIIDPGCYLPEEENEIIAFIEENKLTPVRLLNTHGHIDHILGNRFIKEKYNLPLEAHQDDEFLMEDAKNYGASFGIIMKEEPLMIDKYLNENDRIEFGNSILNILHVPGHSPGSIVFYNEEQKILIGGDVLFNDSIGRTDLPAGNYDLLSKGIKEKIFALDENIEVYPGHGISTSIAKEKKHNPFLM